MSIIPKMFGALITEKLSKIVSPIIFINQHGFRPNMSIANNILLYQSKILEALNNRVQLDSIYTDFQKAFDKVQHNLLFNKISSFGIHGTLFNWLWSYIHCRTQAVKVSHYISNYF